MNHHKEQLINAVIFQQQYCQTLIVSARTSAAFAESPQPVKLSDVILIEFFTTWHSTTAAK